MNQETILIRFEVADRQSPRAHWFELEKSVWRLQALGPTRPETRKAYLERCVDVAGRFAGLSPHLRRHGRALLNTLGTQEKR